MLTRPFPFRVEHVLRDAWRNQRSSGSDFRYSTRIMPGADRAYSGSQYWSKSGSMPGMGRVCPAFGHPEARHGFHAISQDE